MKKRFFCLVLSALITSCSAICFSGCGKNYDGEVNVYNWGEYIANGEDGIRDVVKDFENKYNIKVNYTTYETNEELYNMLKNSNVTYDVVIPSEYMISKLISENLLQEINYDNVPNYSNIMTRFQTLECDKDRKYTVCYTWGVTGLVYDKTKLEQKPTSWDILWDKDLSGQILMFNNSRDAMAIAMQMCNINPSNCTKEDVDKAGEKLAEQKPLLKEYVMDKVFIEMEHSQATVAPYYAGDIITMMDNNEDLDYAMPEEGANLFYDAMCIPTCSKNKENAEKFINYMLEPDVAAENFKYLCYATPNQKAYDEYIDEEYKNNEFIFPSEEYLNKCYTFSNVDNEVYNYMQEKFVKIQAE